MYLKSSHFGKFRCNILLQIRRIGQGRELIWLSILDVEFGGGENYCSRIALSTNPRHSEIYSCGQTDGSNNLTATST